MSDASDKSALHQAYADASFHLRIRNLRLAVVLALVLVTAFSGLDWVVYPDQFWQLAGIRLVCDFFLALLLVLIVMQSGAIHFIRTLGVVFGLVLSLSITAMILISGGGMSPYYAGLNLVIIVTSVLLPSDLVETTWLTVSTFVLYVAACYFNWLMGYGPEEFSWSTFNNNVFFLIGTIVICMTASHNLSRRRFETFRLNYELDRRNRELAELDRLKSNFFANISHELRTPLTLILTPVQDLLEGGFHLSDSLASRLGIVRDNAFRLLKLVNDLLDVVRLEEGKDQLERTPVEVNAILGSIADSMSHLADTKDLTLEKKLTAAQLVVDGDVRAFEKIFVNLINNAVKFTSKGGRVRVESQRNLDRAVVRIIDNGIGIPFQEQVHIFERFRQVDGSSTRRYGGTGLGLAVVREMCERMGGEIDVDSTPGKGTVFSISLPLSSHQGTEASLGRYDSQNDELEYLHRLAEYRGGLTIEEPSADLDMQDAAGRDTVLVVEDEPDMRRVLADILANDYRVLQARTGIEGLEMAREHRPNLILLDLMLPEMDGLEVCRHIRADEETRWQKIMLLTARVDERSKIEALQNGADDFLTKPFSSVEVKTRLRNLLATAALERDLIDRNASLQATLKRLESTQAQLVQSEKLNALGSLAAGLLHEINNPLNYSLTALQLIRGDASIRDNEMVQEVVGDIDEGMQRIRAIVSDLRAFAYPSEADKCSPFDFREALDSALRFTSHELSDITVESDLTQGNMVMGSKNHITQVLVNLLLNSAKAIKEVRDGRHGEIHVTGETRDARLSVTVADNGVGMDKKTLGRVFDPFFTTRDVGEGMGLGLSVCHTIVANHGGQLIARSTVGTGSELEFDLPLARDVQIDAKKTQLAAS